MKISNLSISSIVGIVSTFFVSIFALLLAMVLFLISENKEQSAKILINTFEECVAAGNQIAESYPRQCRTKDGQMFAENVGNILEKLDLIKLNQPFPNQIITSPLLVSGEARGTWFFEASFPIVLTNWDGLIIAEGVAQAKDNWMTEGFVPFEAILNFEKPSYGKIGALILQKDNPSGLPVYDDALEIPIRFEP